jgi:hypothetical protein
MGIERWPVYLFSVTGFWAILEGNFPITEKGVYEELGAQAFDNDRTAPESKETQKLICTANLSLKLLPNAASTALGPSSGCLFNDETLRGNPEVVASRASTPQAFRLHPGSAFSPSADSGRPLLHPL